MGKVINITEQLNFEDKPKLKIKNITIEVDDSATNALKLMEIMSNAGENPTIDDLNTMYCSMFSESDRAKIDKLSLNINDFSVLINAAMSLIIGDQEVGEQVSHITTFLKIGTCWSRPSERNMAYRSILMILKK